MLISLWSPPTAEDKFLAALKGKIVLIVVTKVPEFGLGDVS